jgi:hypothetical protein
VGRQASSWAAARCNLCLTHTATRCLLPDGWQLCEVCWMDAHELHRSFVDGCVQCWAKRRGWLGQQAGGVWHAQTTIHPA